jgi:hypothetical protein
MTIHLDKGFKPDILTEFASRLLADGFSSVALRIDESELLLQGMAPSFEAKVRIETEARKVTGLCVRNCLRVSPELMHKS